MESDRYLRLMKYLGIGLLFLSLQGCCWFGKCDDCFEDPNLWFPDAVTNVTLTTTFQPTFVGQTYFPAGTAVGVAPGVWATNEFFSVTRFVQGINQNVVFFWNKDTPPNFSNLEEGETIVYYKTVVNQRQDNSLDCIFETAQEVKSVLDVRVRTNDTGEIVGERKVEKTVFNIPSGQYATFSFNFEYLSCGNYEFNIAIDPDGKLSESSVNDNNYSETKTDFGFCF